MKANRLILITAACLAASIAARAQGAPANPMVAAAQEIYDRQSKFIMASADQMPPDKYSFKPTADQRSFAAIIAHLAQANFAVCAILSDTTAPQDWKVAESDPKDKLVAAVNASFDFCSKALANLQDSKLGDTVKFFGGRPATRARALIELTDDLEDHYSQLASYMRLNGMLPPSAQPKK
jgi:hypothetical protein